MCDFDKHLWRLYKFATTIWIWLCFFCGYTERHDILNPYTPCFWLPDLILIFVGAPISFLLACIFYPLYYYWYSVVIPKKIAATKIQAQWRGYSVRNTVKIEV